MLFLEWSAESATSRADDGVETLLVRDGEIVLRTVHSLSPSRISLG